MSKIVSFNLAKLLKEAGFNEPCSQYFIAEYNGFFKDKDGTLRHCGENKRENSKGQPHIVIAPTIDQVRWWFYEEYKIWIEVFVLNKTFAWKALEIKKGVTWCLFAQQDKAYDSPEKTYKTAFEFVLKISK